MPERSILSSQGDGAYWFLLAVRSFTSLRSDFLQTVRTCFEHGGDRVGIPIFERRNDGGETTDMRLRYSHESLLNFHRIRRIQFGENVAYLVSLMSLYR